MNKKQWQEYYGVYDIDMELIEEARRCNGKIITASNPKLDYKTIKYEMYKK